MGVRLALDTSAALAFLDGITAVGHAMNNAESVCVPSIVIGELYLGVHKCRNPDREMVKINALLGRCEALPVTIDTAHLYASIMHQLESSGKRIPLNDIWIAALSIQHSCTLIAKDAHFGRIDGLKLVSL